MKNKKSQTATDLLNWCDTQQEETIKVVDQLLDSPSWRATKNRKALSLAGEILKNIDLLRQESLQGILPHKHLSL
jgi:hypothetical protein